MVVPREHCDARAGLPVPDPDRLVVRRAKDPRVLIMELHGPDVVQMAQESEDTSVQHADGGVGWSKRAVVNCRLV